MDERASRRRLSVDERRAEILAEAVKIAREVGLVELTLREVRDRAGVSAGLASHYFASLDGLRVAVFHELFDSAEPGEAVSPSRRLAAVIGDFAATGARDSARAWVDALQLARGSAEMRDAVLRRMALDREELTRIILAGCESGEFRSSDPARSARRILVALDGYLMQFFVEEDGEIRSALRRVVWDLAERELELPEGGLRTLLEPGRETDEHA